VSSSIVHSEIKTLDLTKKFIAPLKKITYC